MSRKVLYMDVQSGFVESHYYSEKFRGGGDRHVHHLDGDDEFEFSVYLCQNLENCPVYHMSKYQSRVVYRYFRNLKI